MHDHNGTPLKVGDKVFIPATITNCTGDPTGKYCNVNVETDYLMGQDDPGAYKTTITLNAGQVVLVEAAPAAEPTQETAQASAPSPAPETAPAAE